VNKKLLKAVILTVNRSKKKTTSIYFTTLVLSVGIGLCKAVALYLSELLMTDQKRKQLPSVSTALILSVGIGLFEAIALYLGSGAFLSMMGISAVS
jgi:hypothetical protein